MENSLLAFVYDVPYLGASGVFPPLHLLNQFFLTGGGDGGMSPGASWLPFSLSSQEYSELIVAICTTPMHRLRDRARYASLPFQFDASFDHHTDLIAWVTAVSAKYRFVHLDLQEYVANQPKSGERCVIKFYRTGGAFGQFSNFAAYPIRLNGLVWPTTEHYFQAQKFSGTPHEEVIRLAVSPMKAASMGRERAPPIRTDWDDVKDDVMRTAILAKFEQHPYLRELLLSTGDAEIVEHTKNDSYWGDGGDGSGKNKLGQILMETRRRLGGK